MYEEKIILFKIILREKIIFIIFKSILRKTNDINL